MKDNGRGIPSTDLDRVFKRRVTIGKTEGTGLGLFQAKASVEMMGGTFNLKSEQGHGTTVEITIPMSASPAVHDIEISKNMHIVIVDDDPLVHAAWKKLLPAEVAHDRLHFFFSP